MKNLQEIESQITKTLILIFVAPFVFAYWTDTVIIDLLSLFLISQSKLLTRPTIRGTVIVQLGLYLYFICYLIAPSALFDSKKIIPSAVQIIGCCFYLFISLKAFKTAKLLSPFLADKPLETITKEKLTNN
jgi:threonine/homoserine/homoserine lactone efflux protein